MKKIIGKIIAIALLIPAFGLVARGGHGGGRGSGGHRGGGHRGGRHLGHPGHHPGHHGGYGRGYGRRGWGWGSGFVAGLVGAAIVNGAFYYNGYPISHWEEQDNEYYQTVVLPAYRQYQADPTSVPVKNIEQQVTYEE